MGKIAEKTKRKKLNFVERNVIQTGLLITFEKVQGEEPEGIIYNVHIPYGIHYQGYGELFLKMERPRQNSKCEAGKRQTGRGHLWKIQKDGIFLTVVLRNLSGCLPAVKDGFMRRPCFAATAAGRV